MPRTKADPDAPKLVTEYEVTISKDGVEETAIAKSRLEARGFVKAARSFGIEVVSVVQLREMPLSFFEASPDGAVAEEA